MLVLVASTCHMTGAEAYVFCTCPCRRDTEELPFTLLDCSEEATAMMHLKYEKGSAVQAAKFTSKLADSPTTVDCIAVKLAYSGGGFSAVVAMPHGNLDGDDGLGVGEFTSGQVGIIPVGLRRAGACSNLGSVCLQSLRYLCTERPTAHVPPHNSCHVVVRHRTRHSLEKSTGIHFPLLIALQGPPAASLWLAAWITQRRWPPAALAC